MAERNRRKTLVGVVKSAKMDKTIVVSVEQLVQHPVYKKYIRRRTVVKAHDEKNECAEGDVVEVMETRPLSRTKRWRLVRIVQPSAQARAVGSEG